VVDTAVDKRVVVRATPAEVAAAVAERFVARVVARTENPGKLAHISLTGGSMGPAVLSAAAQLPAAATVDWSRVHFWWSDERFVPAGDPERNDTPVYPVFFDALEIPRESIHAIAPSDSGLDLDEASRAYAAELARFADPAVGAWPSFDICFLGVGPDGHVASLFPDRPEILVTDTATLPVRDSPKPPPLRVTVTRPVINSSKRVWLVMTGSEKASALGLALAGASYASVPAAGAKGRKRTVFFVDEAAAAKVPAQLIDREY